MCNATDSQRTILSWILAERQNGLSHHDTSGYYDVLHNDIIVMGSDGVFDNLFDEQIMSECIQSKVAKDGNLQDPQAIAESITNLAEELSVVKTRESPWTIAAVADGEPRDKNLGGKPDDITAIVAQIKLQ